jgi:hypothetical protein
MNTLKIRWQLTLAAVALTMAIVLPTEAARFIRVQAYRLAVF